MSAAPSPTAQALSYFPASSPLVLTIATDPQSAAIRNARALIQRFPAAALLQTALFARAAQIGINYNQDIRPLFGNPVAVGAVGAQLTGSRTPFLLAWMTKSPRALAALIRKLGSLRPAGSRDGAKQYVASGAAVAVDGATLLFSRSTEVIDQALDRHAHSQGFTAAQYARATTGMSSAALVRVVGNLTGVLSTPQSARARTIPWVAAIRGYGASISAGPSGLTIRYHVDTTGRTLGASQLPIAAGSSAPSVASSLPILTGVRDLPKSIDFVKAAARAVSPASYARFTARVARLKQRSGFDLSALVSMLSGNLYVASDTHTTLACVRVSDPAAVSAMIAKLAAAPGLAFTPGTTIHSLGHGVYAVHERHAELTMAVINHQLLLGRATPAELQSFARAPTSPVAGTSGSVAFKIALPDLLHLTLTHPPTAAAQQFLTLLGNLTGSAAATPSGLTGSATLALR